jgi:hypothetical protein
MKNLIEQKEKLKKIIDEKYKKFDYINCKSFKELEDFLEPESTQLSEINRQIRFQKTDYKLSDIPKYGDVMTLKVFIECCLDGGFIDYDGSGNYIQGDKMTDLKILPSDIKNNLYKKEFDKIIWFNR